MTLRAERAEIFVFFLLLPPPPPPPSEKWIDAPARTRTHTNISRARYSEITVGYSSFKCAIIGLNLSLIMLTIVKQMIFFYSKQINIQYHHETIMSIPHSCHKQSRFVEKKGKSKVHTSEKTMKHPRTKFDFMFNYNRKILCKGALQNPWTRLYV